MSILNETAPKRIWLCVSDDESDNDKPYPELYAEDAEITWSTDQPVAATVEYVRVDLPEVAKLRAERDALRALLRELDETWIRSTCPQSIRDRIDAALAGKDAP